MTLESIGFLSLNKIDGSLSSVLRIVASTVRSQFHPRSKRTGLLGKEWPRMQNTVVVKFQLSFFVNQSTSIIQRCASTELATFVVDKPANPLAILPCTCGFFFELGAPAYIQRKPRRAHSRQLLAAARHGKHWS
jgi:hypothetical protein